MSYAAIVGMQVHGSPEPVIDVSGNYLSHNYRGVYSTLLTNKPAVGDDWNGYEVRRVRGPIALANSTYGEMTVDAGTPDSSSATLGSAQITNQEFPFLEVDDIAVDKSLRQHPGVSGMDAADFQALDLWIAETDSDNRALFKYWKRDADGATTGTIQTLSATNDPDNSLQDLATAYLLGIENYTEYAVLARRTSLFKGTTLPAVSDRGQKIVGDPFTGVPSGYEWIKTSDKARKQGRGFVWTRVEEWTGVRKVWVDIDEIFI